MKYQIAAWVRSPLAWAAACMLSVGTPAWAQVPSAPAPTIVLPAGQAKALPSVKGKAIDTRTQQEADRPMKRILEAAALAAAAAAATPTAPPTVTAKATGGGAAAPAPAAGPAPSLAAAAAPRPSRPAPPAEVLLAAASPALIELPVSTSLPSSSASQTPISESQVATVDAGTSLAMPSQPSVAAPAVAALAVEPQLLRMVDVDVSESFLSRLRKRPEVLVELLIDESGAVREAQVRETSHPSLSAPVLAAVRQWVFAPLPQATRHQLRVALAE